jgi:hypothetical protein
MSDLREFVSVSEAAAACEVTPKRISDLIFQRRVNPDGIARLAGRHVVRRSYLRELKALATGRKVSRETVGV